MNSRKLLVVSLAFVFAFSFAACSDSTAQISGEATQLASSESSESLSEGASVPNGLPSANNEMDIIAKELFGRAANEIITLASEAPSDIIKAILGDDIEIIYEEKNIDGMVYYETTADYKEIYDYCSEIFTGDALSWVLSTKFMNISGKLYCSPVGGTSGWTIENLEVTSTGQNSGGYVYEATFNELDAAKTSQFTIEKTESGGRISSMFYGK